MVLRRIAECCGCLVFLLVAGAARAQAPLTFANETGTVSVTVGTLMQPQIDWEQRADADDAASASFRRLRFIASGKLSNKLKFFVETDSPNLGVHTSNRVVKRELYMQDIIVTYEARREVQVDAGLLMVPVSYNSLQSATSLLAVGYGPYSFLASTPTTSKVGRDYGAQLRGYVAGGHVEYRLGMFEGIREIDRGADARVAGRVVWYPYESQTGFFYAGSSLGKKRVLAVGASFDQQESYRSRAVDVYYDRPLAGGDSVTLQADLIHYDGGVRLPALARQTAWLLEAGYYLKTARLGGYAQFARRDLAAPTAADAIAYQAGLAYWLRGHRLNVKVGVGQTRTERQPARTQLIVQSQVLAF